MNKHVAGIFLLCIAMFCFAATGIAEPPRRDFDSPPTREQMEKVRNRIETLKMWKLTKALDLDEKTSAQLFPLLNKYDKTRAELEQKLRNDMRQLRESLEKGRDANLKNILDGLENNHKSMQKLNDEERAELKKTLTIEQQAKFIIFQQEFERDIRKIIEEVKERRPERFERNRTERPLRPERSERDRPERPLPPDR